jgi:PPK2 family polyphosphate:nucleotide phosphotransferase
MAPFLRSRFVVPQGKRVRLQDWPTEVDPFYRSKEDYQSRMEDQIRDLSELQGKLYAHNQYALLLIFQAMDAAGKDSAIKHVMSGVNPQGCQVFSFKHPSPEELDHDFMWRTTRALPERGRIGIFNRSYYEEVLIVRVHPEILRSQGLPAELVNPKTLWRDRYRSIADMESHLARNGTRIVKFYLHISKEEQRRRFLKRIEEPDKNWKFSARDVAERALWDQYMKAYEDCLSATSTAAAPWCIVPADDKMNARLIIAGIVVEALRSLRLTYPQLSPEHQRELRRMRDLLEAQKQS